MHGRDPVGVWRGAEVEPCGVFIHGQLGVFASDAMPTDVVAFPCILLAAEDLGP